MREVHDENLDPLSPVPQDAGLRDWLMRLVGTASTLNSAKRVVERLVEDALADTSQYRAAAAERDRVVRLFNRLDAAISHHKRDNDFADLEDEALWAARDRILSDYAAGRG